ncbi:MAG: preprotein translocase subunit SecG [Desulfobacteria bacterium]
MSTAIIIVHVSVCVALILIVLLQTGKGANMGAAFGGGSSQTLFGSSGAGGFLTKLTTGAAVVFMLTSFALAYLAVHKTGDSVMSGVEAPVSATEVDVPQEETEPAEPTPQAQKEEEAVTESSQQAGKSENPVSEPASTQRPEQ